MQLSSLSYPRFLHKSLGFKLGLIILIKILFLIGFWNAVLRYQETHVNASDMTDRLLIQSEDHLEER